MADEGRVLCVAVTRPKLFEKGVRCSANGPPPAQTRVLAEVAKLSNCIRMEQQMMQPPPTGCCVNRLEMMAPGPEKRKTGRRGKTTGRHKDV
jgi:hypothetical protein